jgi:NDP-sugar pyrophosphorylase family protein
MQHITKTPIHQLGYHFIESADIPKLKDEYYLRRLQNKSGIHYRKLTAPETEILIRNRNTSQNWNDILVSDSFNPELVKNCSFYGLVRIGKLEPCFLGFHDFKFPVGLYNSTIISCDIGDNVVIDNVHYLTHFIIGNQVIIVNVNEMVTTNHAKFGNGIVKEGEPESIRIWLELCNENGGRKVIPFSGMLPADAWLWSKYRDDHQLLQRFQEFTEQFFRKEKGYYGMVGDRTVIKNCFSLKDVWIGSDAYVKGATKLKNLTIHSQPGAKSQIGEGCELVNGIINEGCTAFYGVKAVRFIMASHSQLKYGARLINSYLGNNATISCCEVLNSLIFPGHEQHHNNSFLCAALIMGQSNIAAGATIGSNHNSRGADGELIAGRGFWPGLCVSLKHNSRFASFTMIAKGDYHYELDIQLPFSLVSIDSKSDALVVMPAYWFMYNMYALARNAWKYKDRDKRVNKEQFIEFDYLAPDTVNEMLNAVDLLCTLTGKAWQKEHSKSQLSQDQVYKKGKEILENQDPILNKLTITAPGFENSQREVRIIKVYAAYREYIRMIRYYGIQALISAGEQAKSYHDVQAKIPTVSNLTQWHNVGGQLIEAQSLSLIRERIKDNSIKSWIQLHSQYKKEANQYPAQRLRHGLAVLSVVTGFKNLKKMPVSLLQELLSESLETRKLLTNRIFVSREKDYNNPFRKMVYDTESEMNQVLGKLSENSFIEDERKALATFSATIKKLKKNWQNKA